MRWQAGATLAITDTDCSWGLGYVLEKIFCVRCPSLRNLGDWFVSDIDQPGLDSFLDSLPGSSSLKMQGLTGSG
jgi:hypothetical protein